MFNRFLFILSLSFLFSINSTNAQKGYELGGWIGTGLYFGDLNTRLGIKQPGLAFGLNARNNFNTRIAAKASLNFARIGANDDNSSNNFERRRNLDFNSNIYDFTGQMEFNFFEYKHGSKIDYWTPYLSLGFSAFRYNPTSSLNDVKYNLRDYGTEGQEQGSEYGRFNGGLTLGFGWKWDINEDWSLNAEFTVRKIFTDYLDDVSKTYPDPATLTVIRGDDAVIARGLSNKSIITDFGRAGTQRGNSKDNDTYALFGISLMRYFGELECPKISR